MSNSTSREEIDALVNAGVAEFEKKMGRPATMIEVEIIRLGLAGHAVERIEPPSGKVN